MKGDYEGTMMVNDNPLILILVGGWTNPSEKYARQIGSFPQNRDENFKNNWVATT